jgi:hypothetical protein
MVIWLILTPKSPIYVITDTYIPTLNGRNSSTSLHHARNTSSILLNLQFSNPNKKMGIYYNNINVTLYYKDAVIASNHSLWGFYQGYNNTTLYQVLLVMTADHQQLRKHGKGVTNETPWLRVCLENVVKYKIFSHTTKYHWIYKEAHVSVGSDGKISGEKNIKLAVIEQVKE